MRRSRAFYAGVCLLSAGAAGLCAAEFEVVNTADAGFGSLRQALEDANDNPGADRIVFNIPGSGVQTFRPTMALPAITDPLEVDGYSQAGTKMNTLADGFDGVLLIRIDGSSVPSSSTSVGIHLKAGFSKVRGLVINRFGYGIALASASNVVTGNLIGLDPSGREASPNSTGIVALGDSGSVVGGTLPEERNVIGGNAGRSFQVGQTASLPSLPLIASTNLSILGNFIGTDATGLVPLPANTTYTVISLQAAENFVLGGLAPGAGNVMTCGFYGIHMYPETDRDQKRILGNFIGVGADGKTPLRNTAADLGSAISATSNTWVEANTIAFSGVGVMVNGSYITILNNRIYSNSVAGIRYPGGPYPNDEGDIDTGPNDLQNYPTLTATSDGSEVLLDGELQSKTDTRYIVQFFASHSRNTNGVVEGERLLDSIEVLTPSFGVAPFTLRYPIPQGFSWITATATDPDGNTSTFSPGVLARSPTFLVFHEQPQSVSASNGFTVTFRTVVSGAEPLRLQWQHDGVDLPRETNATLTLRNIQPAQRGFYQLVASNMFGVLASQPAQLTFLTLPSFVLTPLSQTVVSGEWVTVSVNLSELTTPPMLYRWRSNSVFVAHSFGTNYNSFFRFRAGAANSSVSVVVSNPVARMGLGTGIATITVLPDRDHDGLPDAYETRFNLAPDDPTDALLDPDGDGLSTFLEYQAGTDPTNSVSSLKLLSLNLESDAVLLAFLAASNKTYRLEYTDDLGTVPWSTLRELPARRENSFTSIPDRPLSGRRFYRLVTPW